MIGGYERQITGQVLKVYHNGTKRTHRFAAENSLWYSGYRVCGGFALEITTHFSTSDCSIKIYGGRGGFPSEILITYIYYIKITFYYLLQNLKESHTYDRVFSAYCFARFLLLTYDP